MFVLLLAAFATCNLYAQEPQKPPEVNQATEPLVKAIEVVGIKRIEEGAVKSRLSQKLNQPLSRDKIDADIRTIYKLGYFDDVKVETEFYEGGLKIVYKVKEKPTIVKINFDGNKKFDDDKLKEKITAVKGSIADTALIQDNVEKLKTFYDAEGYYLSEIFPILHHIKDDEVSLTLRINEGKKIKIKQLQFNGNKNISDGKIKKAIKTSTWWIFSFFTGSGYVKRDVLEDDIKAISDLYHDNGYVKVKVSEPKVVVDELKPAIAVVFDIEEGDRYNVSKIEMAGYHAFADTELKKLITIKSGTMFSKKTLTNDIASVAGYYSERGYATITITPEVVPDDNTKTVSIYLKVEEGTIYKIGRIEAFGNTKTRDKVIRREVTLDEGDIFNSKKLKRSYQNVNNLDFFESVEFIPRPQPDTDIVDIDVKVKEKSTAFVSFGGGYSSIDRLIGMVQLTQANVFGSGQYLKVSAELGGVSSLYEITYKEPWLFDKPISGAASIYRLEREYIKYSRRASGTALGVGKRFAEYYDLGVMYRFEDVNVFDVQDDAPKIVKEQIGKATTSSITPTLTRDTRDNYNDPSEGSRNSVYVTFAGLGGSNAFLKSGVDSLWFFPFFGPTTLSFRGRYGYGSGVYGKNLPIYERFYVGGISTIRGLVFGEAGPTDTDGTYIGGTSQLLFNGEFIFPIVSEIKLKGVVFVDTGSSFESGIELSEFKYTSGGGFRWISPFGPIRIEYGHNLHKKPGESSGRVEFSFGSFF
ncbi:outer membrane protein assembly complex, YaeT protein [Candidatus Magnetobacterium bavaricum]|uniref:Outer membrane protein assembly factor BamA n=1 Tax=Candidatus Magnetobacterium bavaricum TaxID=29290 RepID=A0A0F3GU21_9BACT|nr:outer membrane protein assembly complex, YaeT protein [Candidatus Magnetobacterium bavaricum]